MGTLLFFSRDPGAANQLVAVHDLLRGGFAPPRPGPGLASFLDAARGVETVCVVAKDAAVAVWREAGVAPVSWQDMDVDALLRGGDVTLLVSGTTDVDDGTDRALWRAARAAGVASHAFLDCAGNLRRRFIDQRGEMVLPDWIYAPDENVAIVARRELPVDPDRVRIAGPLFHDRLAVRGREVPRERLAELRAEWGAGEGDRVLLFASECGAEMRSAGRPVPYDEIEVLRCLIERVARGENVGGNGDDSRRMLLVVRPHPRDTVGKYDSYRGDRRLRVTVSSAGRPDEAVLAADLVVGMRSSLLDEAAVLGRPTLSLIEAAGAVR